MLLITVQCVPKIASIVPLKRVIFWMIKHITVIGDSFKSDRWCYSIIFLNENVSKRKVLHANYFKDLSQLWNWRNIYIKRFTIKITYLVGNPLAAFDASTKKWLCSRLKKFAWSILLKDKKLALLNHDLSNAEIFSWLLMM